MEQHTLLQREESPRSPAAPSLRRLGGSRHITHWDPEDLGAWEAGNKGIARRNLLWSVVTVHLGYSVWTLWPVLELLMPQDVYGFSTSDKFLLGTIATLFGAFLRMPYALASAIFGGRNWATFSAIVLLIPAIGTTVLLTHPGLPLWPYLVCAALTGLGGGNFASSMSNANAFYPHRLKGSALGIAGGVGNLGVPAIQLVGLLAIATVGERKPYLVCARQTCHRAAERRALAGQERRRVHRGWAERADRCCFAATCRGRRCSGGRYVLDRRNERCYRTGSAHTCWC